MIEEFWNNYLSSINETTETTQKEYQSWHFMTEDPKDEKFANELAYLVKFGIKTATATLADIYNDNRIPYPSVGSYHLITTFEGDPTSIVRATKVTVVPYGKVSTAHAYKEGEKDRTLNTWRKIHEVFFSDLLQQTNKRLSNETSVLCIEFELIYTE